MASTSEYWVGDMIGEGSFGVVVYGRYKHADSCQHNDQLHVAIKCMDKSSLHKQPSLAMAVIQEQRLLKRLKEKQQQSTTVNVSTQQDTSRCESNADTNARTHINNRNNNNNFIVDLYASFHDKECVYLVLECCSGGTLQELLDHYRSNPNNSQENIHQKVAPTTDSDDPASITLLSTKLSLETTQYYGIQLVMGISFIHSRSIIHCDIKPSNILLTNYGCIKISDFGSSIDLLSNHTIKQNSVVNDPNSFAASNVPNKSSGRVTIPRGTAAYAAPELNRQPRPQSKQNSTDDDGSYVAPTIAVDLWSLGCLLFACLSEESLHQSPFDKGSEAACIQAQKDYIDIMDTNERHAALFGNDLITLADNVNGKNNVSVTDGELILGLKRMIAALLNPEPNERINFAKKGPDKESIISESLTPLPQQKDTSSVTDIAVNHLLLYPNLQSNSVWGMDELAQLQLKKDFLPPTPSWWIKNSSAPTSTTSASTTKATTASQESSDTSTPHVLLDGAMGWSAFLVL
jgi:serine/threonine protein kinase